MSDCEEDFCKFSLFPLQPNTIGASFNVPRVFSGVNVEIIGSDLLPMTNFRATPVPKLSVSRHGIALLVRGLPLTQGQIMPISTPGLVHVSYFLLHQQLQIYSLQRRILRARCREGHVFDVWT
jgi:hypothetical protein